MKIIQSYENHHTISGTVSSVLYKETKDGQSRSIFNLKLGKNTTHTVVAGWKVLSRVPEHGEIWECKGSFTRHPKYGHQLDAQDGVSLEPENKHLEAYIATCSAFTGWGPDKTRKLVLKVPKLKSVLNAGDHSQISKRTGIGQSLCRQLVKQWNERMCEVRIAEFLFELGVPKKHRQLLQGCYGCRAIDRIKEDPYRLLAFMSWEIVDEIATTHFAMDNEDTRRAVGAVEASLYEALAEGGHMGLPTKILIARIRKKGIGTPWKEICQIAQKAFLTLDNDIVQGLGCFALENVVRDRLRALAGNPEHTPLIFRESLLAEFEAQKRREIKLSEFKLDPEQVQAIQGVTENYLSVITGGAGTGKTTLIEAIIHQHESRGKYVYLAAMTGRAARRMALVTGHKAETLFRFNLRIKRRLQLKQLEDVLIIVDEASMLDPAVAYKLLKELPNGCRLCLVGDHRQLPPISAGLVFHQLANAKTIHLKKYQLVTAHRAALTTGIPQVACAIRDQVIPKTIELFTKRSPEIGVFNYDRDATDVACMTRVMPNIYRHMKQYGEDVIMLTYNKNTCASINDIMQDSYLKEYRASHGGNDPLQVLLGDTNYMFYLGEPIVYLNNNYSKDLSNGSFGIISAVYDYPRVLEGELVIAEAEFEEGLRHLTTMDFSQISLAYCLTSHKAQGSQWERVLVALDNPHRIDNSWLYTAVTRASKQVVLIGSRSIIDRVATSDPDAKKRYLGTPIEAL